jgi:DNA-binding CsgD family transcriptional regulator
MPLAPALVARLVAQYVRCPPLPTRPTGRLDGLTERELEVLVLIGHGRSNPEIAEQLVISLPTVKSHVHHILAKLDLRDGPQAVVLAHECGLRGVGLTPSRARAVRVQPGCPGTPGLGVAPDSPDLSRPGDGTDPVTAASCEPDGSTRCLCTRPAPIDAHRP